MAPWRIAQMIADDPQMILGLCRSLPGRRLP
jgi:hypothetical protein